MKPAKSPTTPPPRAMIGDLRSRPCSIACVYSVSATDKDLDCSPAGMMAILALKPALVSKSLTLSAYNGAIFVSVMIKLSENIFVL